MSSGETARRKPRTLTQLVVSRGDHRELLVVRHLTPCSPRTCSRFRTCSCKARCSEDRPRHHGRLSAASMHGRVPPLLVDVRRSGEARSDVHHQPQDRCQHGSRGRVPPRPRHEAATGAPIGLRATVRRAAWRPGASIAVEVRVHEDRRRRSAPDLERRSGRSPVDGKGMTLYRLQDRHPASTAPDTSGSATTSAAAVRRGPGSERRRGVHRHDASIVLHDHDDRTPSGHVHPEGRHPLPEDRTVPPATRTGQTTPQGHPGGIWPGQLHGARGRVHHEQPRSRTGSRRPRGAIAMNHRDHPRRSYPRLRRWRGMNATTLTPMTLISADAHALGRLAASTDRHVRRRPRRPVRTRLDPPAPGRTAKPAGGDGRADHRDDPNASTIAALRRARPVRPDKEADVGRRDRLPRTQSASTSGRRSRPRSITAERVGLVAQVVHPRRSPRNEHEARWR